MSRISTHVLDTSAGRPAAGISVRLLAGGEPAGESMTDEDGRVRSFLPEGTALKPGTYRLIFETGKYFPQGFYPEVSIAFIVSDPAANYHVPLLLSPFGYTTYRGS